MELFISALGCFFWITYRVEIHSFNSAFVIILFNFYIMYASSPATSKVRNLSQLHRKERILKLPYRRINILEYSNQLGLSSLKTFEREF